MDKGISVLHRCSPEVVPGALSTGCKDLYRGGDLEVMSALVESGEVSATDFTFFIGFCGWGNGQLSGEVENNTWLAIKDDELVCSTLALGPHNYSEEGMNGMLHPMTRCVPMTQPMSEKMKTLKEAFFIDFRILQWRRAIESIGGGSGSRRGYGIPVDTDAVEGDQCAGGGGDGGARVEDPRWSRLSHFPHPQSSPESAHAFSDVHKLAANTE